MILLIWKINPIIKYLQCFIIFFVSIIIPIIFVTFNIDLSNILILEDEFLITFIGALLALGITLIALLYSILDKIAQILINANKYETLYPKVNSSINELKQDIFLVFYLLVILFFISFLSSINIPKLSFPSFLISRSQFYQSIKFSILLLSLFSTNDVIKAIFSLLSIVNK